MAGQRVGYLRVSGFDQNPDRQLENLDLAETAAYVRANPLGRSEAVTDPDPEL